MRNFRLTILSALAATVTSFAPVHAATVNVEVDTELAYQSSIGVGSRTSTTVIDLVGLEMKSTYSDGTNETWGWEQYNRWRAGTDHVSDDLSVSYSRHGFAMNATKRLRSFTVDLFAANMIWDAGEYGNSDPRNSPTTSSGQLFAIKTGGENLMGTILATYSGRVQIGGHTTGEDAYTKLFIDFSGLEGGGLLGSIVWDADTDVLAVPGDLAPVPLPAGGLLLLTGFAGFGVMSRRRKGRSQSA